MKQAVTSLPTPSPHSLNSSFFLESCPPEGSRQAAQKIEERRELLAAHGAAVGVDRKDLSHACHTAALAIWEAAGNGAISARNYFEGYDKAGVRREIGFIAARLLCLDGLLTWKNDELQLTPLGVTLAQRIQRERANQ